MTAKDILIKARGLISQEDSWIEGDLEDSNGARCSIGAISYAAAGRAEYQLPQSRAAVKKLAKTIDPEGSWRDYELAEDIVVEYNDTHDHDCVLAAFDAAIKGTKK